MTGIVSRETIEKIDIYIDGLKKWNKKINLISRKDIDHIKARHIEDCKALISIIPQNYVIADIGSGNGLPAIILGIYKYKKLILVESNINKCTFLQYMKSILQLDNVQIRHNKVENLKLSCDVITSRAFAPIKKTLELTNHIKPSFGYILMKGKNYTEELIEAERDFRFSYQVKNVNSLSNIIKITDR